jgi:hypothetical protein
MSQQLALSELNDNAILFFILNTGRVAPLYEHDLGL